MVKKLKRRIKIKEYPIDNFFDYIQLIDEISEINKNKFLLFRGQDIDLPLLPKIARNDTIINIRELENKLFDEFKRRSYSYLNFEPKTKLDYLAIAQHYGLPTRLLDWTENPLIALFFACKPNHLNEDHMVVWKFATSENNIITPSENIQVFNQPRTKIFKPNHITKRIVAQSGWFTLHKLINTNEFVALEKNVSYSKSLLKITIPKIERNKMLGKLDKFGINSSNLFPDLDGLCNYLNWKLF